MNQEYEWSKLPIVKITSKDRELARMILSGTPNGDEHKFTRGFLFYNVIESDYIEKNKYENFLKLLQAYLFANWNISNWDEAIEGKTAEELEWEPHLDAYRLMKIGYKRLEKIAQ